MSHIKRWMVAASALVIGGGVSAALLVAANPDRSAFEVYAATHDVPAGAALTPDDLALERVNVPSGRSLLFGRGDEQELSTLRAAHDLASGQLIQRADVAQPSSAPDRRLVFIPVKDMPVVSPGSRVDLLVLEGTMDHPAVIPFAIGVEVRASVPNGLVVVVPSKQAAAFIYAANAMRLAAVIAEPGAAGGVEGPISSPEQALAAVAQS